MLLAKAGSRGISSPIEFPGSPVSLESEFFSIRFETGLQPTGGLIVADGVTSMDLR
jgi:hypothetical protein